MEDDGLRCVDCGTTFQVDRRTKLCALVHEATTSEKSEIQTFWGDLYKQLYEANDSALTPEILTRQIDQLEDLFHKRRQSCVVEMPLSELEGKRVLEVGSGSGGHSCIFKKHGALVTAVDITAARAASTAQKFAMIPGGRGIAYQADAETLPFRDGQFDIVYSNGVFHHSNDTEKCVAEAYRVLKPGGLAVIMLYSRLSAAFLFHILPRGILTGEIFRWPEAEWIGRLTEGKPKFATTKNPITRVYSKKQMERLFSQFDIESLRKWSFQFDNFCVPRLTQIRRAVMKRLGYELHPGGTIVYGQPFVPECGLELWLGRYLGFGWTIAARKPHG